MISILVFSYKEPDTIATCIRSAVDVEYSGLKTNFELIQVSPDEPTLNAGKAEAARLGLGDRYKQLTDPHKGKPFAVNLALKEASGDIIVMTDGDTYCKPGAIQQLIQPLIQESKIIATTGQPVSRRSRDEGFWGYASHFFTSVGHKKREEVFSIRRPGYRYGTEPFLLSGYLMAFRHTKTLELPADIIIDDGYITHALHSPTQLLAYVPDAQVVVNYPTNLRDYLKQRERNLIGHADLKKYNELQISKNSRSFFEELKYVLYPIRFAKTPKEYLYSLGLYTLRLTNWVFVVYTTLFKRSIMSKRGWTRIESSK